MVSDNDMRALQIKVARQGGMIDGLIETVETLVKAVSGLETLVARHDHTIQLMHKAMHQTTDPGLKESK